MFSLFRKKQPVIPVPVPENPPKSKPQPLEACVVIQQYREQKAEEKAKRIASVQSMLNPLLPKLHELEQCYDGTFNGKRLTFDLSKAEEGKIVFSSRTEDNTKKYFELTISLYPSYDYSKDNYSYNVAWYYTSEQPNPWPFGITGHLSDYHVYYTLPVFMESLTRKLLAIEDAN